MPYIVFIDFLKLHVVLPEEWEPQETDFKVFTLDANANDEEFWRVANQFFQTLPNAEIRTIERIQNRVLWRKYAMKAKSMEDESVPRGEMTLFHGTRQTNPKQIYEGDDSFDMRLSNNGMWGRGNYFAVNASYSDGYAYCCNGRLKKLILAQVLTGITYFCQPQHTLTMPPLRPATGQTGTVQRRYNSVSGQTGGSKVYITYENNLAYPAYIITYTTQLV